MTEIDDADTVKNRVNRDLTAQLGLVPGIGIIAAALVVETLLMSYLIKEISVHAATNLHGGIRGVQHGFFCFMIAYAASFAMLVYLHGAATLAAVSATAANT